MGLLQHEVAKGGRVLMMPKLRMEYEWFRLVLTLTETFLASLFQTQKVM